MADAEPVTLHVVGLPQSASLGELEGIILPRISGRIVAIGLRAEGTAIVEFARAADASAHLRDPARGARTLGAVPRAQNFAPASRRAPAPQPTFSPRTL